MKNSNKPPYEGDLTEEEYFFEEFPEEDKNITRWQLKEILNLPWDDVKEGQYLDFSNKWLWPKAAAEIVNHLNFGIKWITIDLSDNWILDEWVFEFMYLHLGEWVTLNLSNNNIFWIFAAGLIFNIEFSEKSTVDLSNNEISDVDLETYYEDIKKDKKNNWFIGLETSINLEKWAKLDLSNNYIWDKWAKILMKTTTLEEWSIIDLSGNNRISDEMKKELKDWEKTYHDAWINCEVII